MKGRVQVFAFGSNLDWHQIVRRCPSVRVVGPAAVEHERLAFVGFSRGWGGAVATLVPAEGKVTAGMVYSMTRADLRVLDACEGHPNFYLRQTVSVHMLRTREDRLVWTYCLSKEFAPPTPAYVRAIRRGYERWGFPMNWLRSAVRYSRRQARKEQSCFLRLVP